MPKPYSKSLLPNTLQPTHLPAMLPRFESPCYIDKRHSTTLDIEMEQKSKNLENITSIMGYLLSQEWIDRRN